MDLAPWFAGRVERSEAWRPRDWAARWAPLRSARRAAFRTSSNQETGHIQHLEKSRRLDESWAAYQLGDAGGASAEPEFAAASVAGFWTRLYLPNAYGHFSARTGFSHVSSAPGLPVCQTTNSPSQRGHRKMIRGQLPLM